MTTEELEHKEATPIEEVSNEIQTPSEAAKQAVEEAHKPPSETKKVLGEFDTEEDALRAFTTLKTYAQQQIAQQVALQQQEEMAVQEAARRIQELPLGERPVSEDEAQILKSYVQAVNDKKYDEALLILKRGIEEKTTRDAAILAKAIVRQELDAAVAPHRARQQLLENRDLSDLHPVADHAVWLAEHLGRLGIPKKQVAGFIRDVGRTYAAANFKKPAASGDWEEPSNSWADLTGKDFDVAADAFWDKQLGLTKR